MPFDPATLADLPAPAARWLTRALPPGTPLRRVVEVEMTGRIRLGSRWFPFAARQVLRSGSGFVWKAMVGGRILRFAGADLLGPHDARMDFRLHGLVPVARASGLHTARSAAGRLAAETVAWLPSAATPQAGANWTPVDDRRATVALATPHGPVEVTVTVGDDGRLAAISLTRWNDAAKPPSLQPFGAEVTSEAMTDDGHRIAGTAIVGWDHGTDRWSSGRFFEFTVVAARATASTTVAAEPTIAPRRSATMPTDDPKPPRLPPRWFMRAFWLTHRRLYRLTRGRLGLWRPKRRGWGALRLTTTGRRSGRDHSVMVGYFEDGPDLVTLAMNGWGEGEPAWWLNLQAHPDAHVDHPDGPREVTGRAARGDERDRLWARWREIDDNLDAFARRRGGETAVVVLEPRRTDDGDDDGAGAGGP